MRQSLAILLLSIHLFGNTELGQVFRLPRLLAHYFQHHRIDPGLAFFDFMQMHYAGDDGTTADDDIDNELPFHNLTHTSILVQYSPMVMEIQAPDNPFREPRIYFSNLRAIISSKHVLMILQPPRSV